MGATIGSILLMGALVICYGVHWYCISDRPKPRSVYFVSSLGLILGVAVMVTCWHVDKASASLLTSFLMGAYVVLIRKKLRRAERRWNAELVALQAEENRKTWPPAIFEYQTHR